MLTPEQRLDVLEELVIDEFARVNCWSRSGRFDDQLFESWKDNLRNALRKKQAAFLMSQPIQPEPPEDA